MPKAATSGVTSIVVQHVALVTLTGPQDSLREVRDRFRLPYGVPHGAQFVFVDISSTGMGPVTLA